MLLYFYSIWNIELELSEKKIELVKNAIKNSRKFNFEESNLDEIINKVIKKSSFILSSLSDDSLITKYLNKVIDDVVSECPMASDSQTIKKETVVALEPASSENSFEIENTQEELALEDSLEVGNFENNNFNQGLTINLDEVIDKVEEIKQTDFSEISENENIQTLDIAQEVVISNAEADEKFDYNNNTDDDALIVPEIDIEEQEYNQPVFDLPKDEFPTADPEVLYSEIEDPIVHKEVKTVPQDVTDKILGILIEATKVPETKDYIKIFYLKYIKKMKQVEIAKLLDMSEGELAETYFDMVKYVKLKLY